MSRLLGQWQPRCYLLSLNARRLFFQTHFAFVNWWFVHKSAMRTSPGLGCFNSAIGSSSWATRLNTRICGRVVAAIIIIAFLDMFFGLFFLVATLFFGIIPSNNGALIPAAQHRKEMNQPANMVVAFNKHARQAATQARSCKPKSDTLAYALTCADLSACLVRRFLAFASFLCILSLVLSWRVH